jgi:hypothetical protein
VDTQLNGGCSTESLVGFVAGESAANATGAIAAIVVMTSTRLRMLCARIQR